MNWGELRRHPRPCVLHIRVWCLLKQLLPEVLRLALYPCPCLLFLLLFCFCWTFYHSGTFPLGWWQWLMITWNSKSLVKGSDKTHRLPETGECGFLCTSCLPLTLVFGCWLCFTFLVLIWKYQSWGQDVKQSKEAWKRYSRSREIITTWKWTYTTGKN